MRRIANYIDSFQLVGDVSDQDVIFVDDIGDTLGTMYLATLAARDAHARSVRALLYHPVLGNGAERNLERMFWENTLDELIFCDTIPLKLRHEKIRQIPVEPFFAEAVRRLHCNESFSEMHKYDQIVKLYTEYSREGFVDIKGELDSSLQVHE